MGKRELLRVNSSGMIIPAGADAEERNRPVRAKRMRDEFAEINMQLRCESIEVAFDCAGRNSCGHANFSVTEALGQQIKNSGFSRVT